MVAVAPLNAEVKASEVQEAAPVAARDRGGVLVLSVSPEDRQLRLVDADDTAGDLLSVCCGSGSGGGGGGGGGGGTGTGSSGLCFYFVAACNPHVLEALAMLGHMAGVIIAFEPAVRAILAPGVMNGVFLATTAANAVLLTRRLLRCNLGLVLRQRAEALYVCATICLYGIFMGGLYFGLDTPAGAMFFSTALCTAVRVSCQDAEPHPSGTAAKALSLALAGSTLLAFVLQSLRGDHPVRPHRDATLIALRVGAAGRDVLFLADELALSFLFNQMLWAVFAFASRAKQRRQRQRRSCSVGVGSTSGSEGSGVNGGAAAFTTLQFCRARLQLQRLTYERFKAEVRETQELAAAGLPTLRNGPRTNSSPKASSGKASVQQVLLTEHRFASYYVVNADETVGSALLGSRWRRVGKALTLPLAAFHAPLCAVALALLASRRLRERFGDCGLGATGTLGLVLDAVMCLHLHLPLLRLSLREPTVWVCLYLNLAAHGCFAYVFRGNLMCCLLFAHLAAQGALTSAFSDALHPSERHLPVAATLFAATSLIAATAALVATTAYAQQLPGPVDVSPVQLLHQGGVHVVWNLYEVAVLKLATLVAFFHSRVAYTRLRWPGCLVFVSASLSLASLGELQLQRAITNRRRAVETTTERLAGSCWAGTTAEDSLSSVSRDSAGVDEGAADLSTPSMAWEDPESLLGTSDLLASWRSKSSSTKQHSSKTSSGASSRDRQRRRMSEVLQHW